MVGVFLNSLLIEMCICLIGMYFFVACQNLNAISIENKPQPTEDVDIVFIAVDIYYFVNVTQTMSYQTSNYIIM